MRLLNTRVNVPDLPLWGSRWFRLPAEALLFIFSLEKTSRERYRYKQRESELVFVFCWWFSKFKNVLVKLNSRTSHLKRIVRIWEHVYRFIQPALRTAKISTGFVVCFYVGQFKKQIIRPSKKKKKWLPSFFQKFYGREGGFYLYFIFDSEVLIGGNTIKHIPTYCHSCIPKPVQTWNAEDIGFRTTNSDFYF